MKQRLIGMEECFRTSGTSHCSLTTHHTIQIDLSTPRQGTSDPHRDWIWILRRSLTTVVNYLTLSTYLGRSPGPELLQPWEPSGHVLERPTDAVVIPSPQRDTPGVRNLFVSIYFSHFELFLPTNTHSPNTCSHLRYALTMCLFPSILFRFHHSHQV